MIKLKEGKKANDNPFEDIPINNSKTKCDECNNDLIKLETILGEAKIRGTLTYKDMYWVCVCTECGRYIKVFEHETKIGNVVTSDNVVTPNKIHKLRER